MTNEDIVREQLRHLGPERGATGQAALDALVAERDEALLAVRALERNRDLRCEELEAERDRANAEWHRIRDLHADAISDLRAAEAERDEAIACRTIARALLPCGSSE